MTRKIVKEAGILLAIIGLTGAVFFFPMKFEDGNTCLAQHYVGGEISGTGHHLMKFDHGHGHDLAQEYIIPYGLIWWTSLGMLVFGLYLTRYKVDKQIQVHSNVNGNGHKLLSV